MLQKEATRTLSRFSLRLSVVREHLHSRAWVTGLALDLGGALLMVASYAMAPVSWIELAGQRRRCAAA